MSSAQAAALAAFSSSKTSSDQKKPPSLKLGADINNFIKKQPPSRVQTPVPTPGKNTGVYTGPGSTPRAKFPAETPTFGAVVAQNTKNGKNVSNPPTSRCSAGSAVGSGSRVTPVALNTRTPRIPKDRAASRTSFSGINGPQSSSPVDYFSLPRLTSRSSPELDKTRENGYILANSGTDTPRSTKSSAPASTKPQDMLDQVRASIQSKSKTGTGKEARQKGQIAIDEFRQSVDSRRLMSQANQIGTAYNEKRLSLSIDRLSLSSHPNVSREEVSRDPLSARTSRQSSDSDSVHRVARLGTGSNNISQSSLPSVVSDECDSGDAGFGSQFAPNFRISFCDSHSSEALAKQSISSVPPKVKDSQDRNGSSNQSTEPEDAPSPIPIPLSSQGVNRGLAAVSSDSMPRGSLSAGFSPSLGSDFGAELIEGPAKPGRKKPPVDSFDLQSSRTSVSDLESSGPGISESSDIDTDDTDGGMKFPLFPGISEKHHRIGLFSKGKKKRDRGVVYDPESSSQQDENDHENDAEKTLGPQVVREVKKAASVAKSQAQPVKLKTTMRKEDKRKERKTAFNEDKPWKNHGDLDAISDAQRKRYEGLWVSNKGLYLEHVATVLVGVNETESEDNTLSKTMRDLSEQEISQRAAKLSASLNIDFDQPDTKELHGLESAQKSNLIHGSVVRKLWARSNLPRETLHAIWELVDCRKDGTLSRAEFIVGMWLVDQCLYGRKLPKVVGKSVWSSLGGLGVNVVVKKKRR